jgi:hypothetical protein
MAAQVTAGTNSFLESSFNDVTGQFASGVKVPTVSFTKISTAKIEGIETWKHYLQYVLEHSLHVHADMNLEAPPAQSWCSRSMP